MEFAWKKHRSLEFTAKVINLRKAHKVFRRTEFFSSSKPEIDWFNSEGKTPDWGKLKRFLAFRLMGGVNSESSVRDNDFYIAANMDMYDLTITVPSCSKGKKWYMVVDTSISGSDSVKEPGNEELLTEQQRYVLPSDSFIVLIAK